MDLRGTVLVTGAPRGIERDAARSAAARPDAMHPEACDVTSPEQVAARRDRAQTTGAAIPKQVPIGMPPERLQDAIIGKIIRHIARAPAPPGT